MMKLNQQSCIADERVVVQAAERIQKHVAVYVLVRTLSHVLHFIDDELDIGSLLLGVEEENHGLLQF